MLSSARARAEITWSKTMDEVIKIEQADPCLKEKRTSQYAEG